MLTAWGFILFMLYHVSFARVPQVEPEFLNMLRETGQHEEFAKYLGLNDVSLVLPLEGRSEEENLELFSNVSSLGDILLTAEQEEQARQGIDFTQYGGNKWRYNIIPYEISNDFTRSQKKSITAAAEHLNGRTKNLKFVPRKEEKDYIMVISGRGCYSNLGRVGGQQTLSLQTGTSCMRTGTIQHEFIHAAGMKHEHSHPDRDDYVSVLWHNIPEDWHSQYEKANSDFVSCGPYDKKSVMHYPMESPNGKDAFKFHKATDTSEVGQRNSPTDLDIQKLDYMYP